VVSEHERVVHFDKVVLAWVVPADALEQFSFDLRILSLTFIGFADLDGDQAAPIFHVLALKNGAKGALTADGFDFVTVVELLTCVGSVSAIVLGRVRCHPVATDCVDCLKLRDFGDFQSCELVLELGESLS